MKNHPNQPGQPEPTCTVEKHSTMSPLPQDSSIHGPAGVTPFSIEHGEQPNEAFEDLKRRVDALWNRTNGAGEKASGPAVPEPSKDKSPISINTEEITPHRTPAPKFTYEAYILRPCASSLPNSLNWSYKIERLHLDEAALEAHVTKLGPDFDILGAVGALLPEQICLIQEGIKRPFERLVVVQFGAALDLVTLMGTFRVKPVIFVIRSLASESPVPVVAGFGREQNTVCKSAGAGTRCGIPEHGLYPLLKASDGSVSQFMTITPELGCKSALGSVSFEEARVADYAARRKYAECSCLVFPAEDVSLGFDGHVAVGGRGPFFNVCSSAGFGHGAQSATDNIFNTPPTGSSSDTQSSHIPNPSTPFD
ncbi:hypothetical protein IAQ61_009221 [Plenodomus lingam]|uniref:uncharacterized protein n=1 Tax=Leptosphaeria maculans TaxID=5022 RepID=UPI00331F565D|nr:hypothetical protein IAQ61_009221 [Plenodomus lingam]